MSTHGDDFTAFWSAYPRKVGKGSARTAFARALRKTTLQTLLDALRWQRNQPGWMKDDGQFIPYPATWLNQERWDDEPFESPDLKTIGRNAIMAALEKPRG